MSDFCFRGEIEFTRLPDDIDTLLTALDNLEGAYGEPPEVYKELIGRTLYVTVATADFANADDTVFEYLRTHQHLILPTCLECWEDVELEPFGESGWPKYFGPESGRDDATTEYYLEMAFRYVRMGCPTKEAIETFIAKLRERY